MDNNSSTLKNIITFKHQTHLFRHTATFFYDNTFHTIKFYESTKVSEYIDKVNEKIQTRNVKFRNTDSTFVPENFFAHIPMMALIGDSNLKNVFIDGIEYSIHKIVEKHSRKEDNASRFIVLDEQNRLSLSNSFTNIMRKYNLPSNEKCHVISFFGSTHAGKSRLIYECLDDEKLFEFVTFCDKFLMQIYSDKNLTFPLIGEETNPTSTTSDIHFYERKTRREIYEKHKIDKIKFLDVEGMRY